LHQLNFDLGYNHISINYKKTWFIRFRY